MYRPDRSELVVTMYVPDDDDDEDEPFFTSAVCTEEISSEKFRVEFVYPFEETAVVHKEDLYENTEENRDRIPDDVKIML